MAIEVRKANGGCGAEVLGVDLLTVGEREMGDLRAAFAEHGVLFFRDQAFSEDDHVAFARRWGEIDINRFFPALPGHPEIALVAKEKAQTTNIGGGWHTDHSYDAIPAMGSILVARTLPSTGGDTLFASMIAAYDALSEETKDKIAGLKAVHSNRHVFGAKAFYGHERNADFKHDGVGEAVHPVVITHPLSGRKSLYVNPGFTIKFEGQTREESQPLLHTLFAHAMRPEFTTRFSWKAGSIAFWDNRASWHFALNDYQGEERVMHRVTIKGVALD
jgi:taurine dioxygenase